MKKTHYYEGKICSITTWENKVLIVERPEDKTKTIIEGCETYEEAIKIFQKG